MMETLVSFVMMAWNILDDLKYSLKEAAFVIKSLC